MDEQQQELFSVQEAAEAWGISKQAVYQRLNKLNKQGFIVEQAKKRYITRDGIEAYRGEVNQEFKQVEQANSTFQPTFQAEVDRLKAALLEAQGRASLLQATVDAQRAHIDSLQAALDKTQTALNQEQTLHLATMQQRLPAGRGSSFMDWITGRGKKTRGTE